MIKDAFSVNSDISAAKTREREKKFAVVLDAANDVIKFQKAVVF